MRGDAESAAFAALADPTRRAILARLAGGEATVQDLAEPFDMSQPAISRHLKVLEQAGLIESRIEGAQRPRRLVPEKIGQVRRWLHEIERRWEENFRRLDGLLDEIDPPSRGDDDA